MSLGRLIKDRRKFLKLTQRELANRAGLSKIHIFKIEHDMYKNGISLDGARVLARELKLGIYEIINASKGKKRA